MSVDNLSRMTATMPQNFRIQYRIDPANFANEEKEKGYDEWLRDRLARAIQKIDSGEMKTYSHEEAKVVLRDRRAELRKRAAIA